MNRKEVEDYILSFDNTKLDYPFGEDTAVYKVTIDKEDKMFALMPEKGDPIRLSLKCDPGLAVLLREKHESIMAGYHLNKKHWNTVLLTGQLTDMEVKDLILHSYNLVTNHPASKPEFS